MTNVSKHPILGLLFSSLMMLSCISIERVETGTEEIAAGGEAVAGEATGGESVAGEATGGEPVAGEATGGGPVAGEITGGEALAGEVMVGGESLAGEATGGEVMAGEVTAGEVIGGETTGGEGTAGTSMVDSLPCVASSTCPELSFIRIDGGNFEMGTQANFNESERPVHTVSVPSFEIMRNEVTVAQYRSCVEADYCSPPRLTEDPLYTWSEVEGERDDYPVNGVSWMQMMTFAAWVGARLPTEAEWEYAARSQGEDHKYPWGNEAPTCDLANFNGDGCGAAAASTCSHPNGNTTQGVCDMSGNVWEWVLDEWHADYVEAPVDGSGWCQSDCPQNASDPTFNLEETTHRVVRGGNWGHRAPNIRSRYRFGSDPSANNHFFGGRLARSLP